MNTIRLKRIYDPPTPDDGTRVLVDRLWPRGVSRERAAIAAWIAAIGPSNALRKWFLEDRSRWEEFRTRYEAELADPEHAQAVAQLIDLARAGNVTLCYAKAAGEQTHASVIAELLERLGVSKAV